MKVVVVDDSAERTVLIRSALTSSTVSKLIDVTYCETADLARRALISQCDLLILDVLIPKKIGGTPQARHSIELLSDICDPTKRYVRPWLIVGLTADIDELGVYQDEFARKASIVLRATMNELGWLDRLKEQVESLVGAEQKSTQEKDKLLVSVHGIRTFGSWQQNLSVELEKYSRSFECVEIKYGFFDLISFVVPPLRRSFVRKSAGRLRQILENRKETDGFIVAHSFGTVIVSEALREPLPMKLNAIVFCGSPLRHDENIDHLVASSSVVVNDCGIHDWVLLLSRFLILGLGDAGRVGFRRENTGKFCNRYFDGGHDLYFKPYDQHSKFYERFWLKLFAVSQQPERVDQRRPYFGQDIVHLVVQSLSFAKPLIYISLFFLCFGIALKVLAFG